MGRGGAQFRNGALPHSSFAVRVKPNFHLLNDSPADSAGIIKVKSREKED